MKTTTKVQKEVTTLFTYIFKNICRVCFVVLSSNGVDRYHTCFDNGRASCTCPAGAKGRICYHVTQLRPRYQAIIDSKQQAPTHEGEGKLPQETQQKVYNWKQSISGDAMEREYEENRKANVRYMYNDL